VNRDSRSEIYGQVQHENNDSAILLTPEEAAAQLRISLRWLYRHWKALPFARKLAPKVLRFDRAGLERWVASKRP
jgi:predicted DNA-binding transcriptional regulator AlpA